jgi:hypothetical protein
MEQPFDFERAVKRVLVLTDWAKLDGLATVYFERMKRKTGRYARMVIRETFLDAGEARINPKYLKKLIRNRQASF